MFKDTNLTCKYKLGIIFTIHVASNEIHCPLWETHFFANSFLYYPLNGTDHRFLAGGVEHSLPDTAGEAGTGIQEHWHTHTHTHKHTLHQPHEPHLYTTIFMCPLLQTHCSLSRPLLHIELCYAPMDNSEQYIHTYVR